MKPESMTDFKALDMMTDREAYLNAAADPDNPPNLFGPRIEIRREDGKTPLECFRKALARERKNSPAIKCDPDILTWFKNRGADYQKQINSVLRSFMEAETKR